MSQTHIRLTRTPEIDKVLVFLQAKYPLLSEAEILKLLLSEKYEAERTAADKGIPNVSGQQQGAIDLATEPDTHTIRQAIRTPRKKGHLLSLAGSFKGAPELSRKKKHYAY
jgi:hypothetical protein